MTTRSASHQLEGDQLYRGREVVDRAALENQRGGIGDHVERPAGVALPDREKRLDRSLSERSTRTILAASDAVGHPPI